MTENKTTVVEHLMLTLQKTSYFQDLLFLEYREKDEANGGGETVVAHFENGTEKVVNVNLDSGVALIQDVMKVLTNGD